jgi:hypothetical protein
VDVRQVVGIIIVRVHGVECCIPFCIAQSETHISKSILVDTIITWSGHSCEVVVIVVRVHLLHKNDAPGSYAAPSPVMMVIVVMVESCTRHRGQNAT